MVYAQDLGSCGHCPWRFESSRPHWLFFGLLFTSHDRSHSRLSRRLGTFDAVVTGLGSMIGAGAFASVRPAAQAAGSGCSSA